MWVGNLFAQNRLSALQELRPPVTCPILPAPCPPPLSSPTLACRAGWLVPGVHHHRGLCTVHGAQESGLQGPIPAPQPGGESDRQAGAVLCAQLFGSDKVLRLCKRP